jgi:hypothetical protein
VDYLGLKLFGVGMRSRGRWLFEIGEGDILDAGVILAHLDIPYWAELSTPQRQVVWSLLPPLWAEGDGVFVEIDLEHERPRFLELLILMQQLHNIFNQFVNLLLTLQLHHLQRLPYALTGFLLFVNGFPSDTID